MAVRAPVRLRFMAPDVRPRLESKLFMNLLAADVSPAPSLHRKQLNPPAESRVFLFLQRRANLYLVTCAPFPFSWEIAATRSKIARVCLINSAGNARA